MKNQKLCARVADQREIAKGIFRLTLLHEAFRSARPGQFLNLYTGDGAHLLPRPISIADINAEAGSLELVYRIAGYGTRQFSRLQKGDEISAVGPLGNGFLAPLAEHPEMGGRRALILGGGIGIPPMYGLAKAWKGEADIVLGFRDEAFLLEEFRATGFPVHTSSDDGSIGTKGTVMDAIREQGLSGGVIFACGPKPMLAAVKTLALEWDVPAYVSLEERMACGIGACLGCVVSTEKTDDHSKVRNARVCADGPVFECREVIL